MARPCPICTADPAQLARVNVLLDSGSTVNAVALLTGFNKYTVQRHKRHAFPVVSVDDNTLSPLERSENRLAELSQRAEESWLAAAALGDARGALDILKSQIRLELDRHSRIQEKQEAEQTAAATNDPQHTMTIGDFDRIVAEYRTKQAEERDRRLEEASRLGFISCPLCSGSNWLHPSQIAERWKACERIYNDFCDEAEAAKAEEQNENVNAVQ